MGFNVNEISTKLVKTAQKILVISSASPSYCHILRGDCTQTQPTPMQNVESVLEFGKHWVFAEISW